MPLPKPKKLLSLLLPLSRNRDTAGAVDQQTVDGVAKAAAHRGEPIVAVVEVVAKEAVAAVEQRHVAERAVAGSARRQDARPRTSRQNGRGREDAGAVA